MLALVKNILWGTTASEYVGYIFLIIDSLKLS